MMTPIDIRFSPCVTQIQHESVRKMLPLYIAPFCKHISQLFSVLLCVCMCCRLIQVHHW